MSCWGNGIQDGLYLLPNCSRNQRQTSDAIQSLNDVILDRFSWQYILEISRLQKKTKTSCTEEGLYIRINMCTGIALLKHKSRNALKKREFFRFYNFFDAALTASSPCNLQQVGPRMIPNSTTEQNATCSSVIMFIKTLRENIFTSLRSDEHTFIYVPTCPNCSMTYLGRICFANLHFTACAGMFIVTGVVGGLKLRKFCAEIFLYAAHDVTDVDEPWRQKMIYLKL